MKKDETRPAACSSNSTTRSSIAAKRSARTNLLLLFLLCWWRGDGAPVLHPHYYILLSHCLSSSFPPLLSSSHGDVIKIWIHSFSCRHYMGQKEIYLHLQLSNSNRHSNCIYCATTSLPINHVLLYITLRSSLVVRSSNKALPFGFSE